MSRRLMEVNQGTIDIIQKPSNSQHHKIDTRQVSQVGLNDNGGRVEILSQRTKKVEEQLMKELEILRSLRDE